MESMTKKSVRSKDVAFLEDQFVGDDDKLEKASSFVEFHIILDTVTPPLVLPADYRGEIQEDDDDTENKDAPMVMMLSQLNKLIRNLQYYQLNLD